MFYILVFSLECYLCMSPKDTDQEVNWYYSHNMHLAQIEELEPDENIFISPRDSYLMIFNIKKQQSGLYVCQLGNYSGSPYIVNVLDDEPLIEVILYLFNNTIPLF